MEQIKVDTVSGECPDCGYERMPFASGTCPRCGFRFARQDMVQSRRATPTNASDDCAIIHVG